MKTSSLAIYAVLSFAACTVHAEETAPFNKYDFAYFAALSDVCGEFVPDKKPQYLANRYLYETKNFAVIKASASEAEYAKIIGQYKNMMRAADTVYGFEKCNALDLNFGTHQVAGDTN